MRKNKEVYLVTFLLPTIEENFELQKWVNSLLVKTLPNTAISHQAIAKTGKTFPHQWVAISVKNVRLANKLIRDVKLSLWDIKKAGSEPNQIRLNEHLHRYQPINAYTIDDIDFDALQTELTLTLPTHEHGTINITTGLKTFTDIFVKHVTQ